MSTPPVQPDSSADADDAIPMLTEVVQVPRYAQRDLPETLGAVDWAALERRVQDNVLDRLMLRSDALLDDNLDAALRTVIGRAVEQLSSELRDALSRLTRELVAQAVAEEIDQVHEQVAQTPQLAPPAQASQAGADSADARGDLPDDAVPPGRPL